MLSLGNLVLVMIQCCECRSAQVSGLTILERTGPGPVDHGHARNCLPLILVMAPLACASMLWMGHSLVRSSPVLTVLTQMSTELL